MGRGRGTTKFTTTLVKNHEYSVYFTEFKFGHEGLKSGTKRGSGGNYRC